MPLSNTKSIRHLNILRYNLRSESLRTLRPDVCHDTLINGRVLPSLLMTIVVSLVAGCALDSSRNG